MSNQDQNISFSSSECPSLDQMVQYKGDHLSSHGAQALEKHLLECEMCQEVFEHVDAGNFAEFTALAGAIDLKVDKRVESSSAGGLNFNSFMALAASFVAVLMFIGNSVNFQRDSIESTELEVAHDPEVEEGREPEELVEEEIPEESEPEETIAIEELADSADNDVEGEVHERLYALEEVGSEEIASEPLDGDVGATEPAGVEEPVNSEPAERYLMASVDLLSVEMIGAPSSLKGSTDKKVTKGKFKSNQGYAPNIEEEVGFPEYSGGEDQLERDIVDKINKLQLSLAQGGKLQLNFTVEANGLVSQIVVEEKIATELSGQIKSVISDLPSWIPGNTKVRYTIDVILQ